MSATQPPSKVVPITAGTNPVTGVEQLVIEYADGSQQVHEGAWSEGREMAHRAGLDHRGGRPGRCHPLEPARAPDPTRTSPPAGGAGGDQQRPSVARPGRHEWDEESGIAVPYDFERTRAIFEAANA